MELYIASASWREWLDVLTPAFKEMSKQEEKYVLGLLRKGYRVLEVGSGSGRLLAAVAPHVEEAIGVEHDYPQAAESEKSLPPNARVIYTDATHLPFEDSCFDLVFSAFNTLGNQGENKFRVLQEQRRVAKPKSSVAASVYAENALGYQLEQYKRYQEMLRDHGFDASAVNIGDTILFLVNGIVGATSERFSKDKLARLFRDTGFADFSIDRLADFSYVVNARK